MSVLCCSVEASLPSQTWNEFCSHHWSCLGCPSPPPLVMSESRMFASAGLLPVSGAGKGWASTRPPKILGSAEQLTPSCSTRIGQLSLDCRSVLCDECLELKLSDNSVNITVRNAQEALHPARKKGNLVQQGHSYHVFLICTSLDSSWPKVLKQMHVWRSRQLLQFQRTIGFGDVSFPVKRDFKIFWHLIWIWESIKGIGVLMKHFAVKSVWPGLSLMWQQPGDVPHTIQVRIQQYKRKHLLHLSSYKIFVRLCYKGHMLWNLFEFKILLL